MSNGNAFCTVKEESFHIDIEYRVKKLLGDFPQGRIFCKVAFATSFVRNRSRRFTTFFGILEIPVFLDPRKLEDVCLVTYDETGGMRPVPDLPEWDRLRVVITNECFALSRFQPLTEGRQRIWQTCSSLIEKYMKAATKQRQEGTPNPVLQQEKNDALLSLKRLLHPREPFATVAASCLNSSPYKWARSLASQPPLLQP